MYASSSSPTTFISTAQLGANPDPPLSEYISASPVAHAVSWAVAGVCIKKKTIIEKTGTIRMLDKTVEKRL
jgi:hypothetical protein